MDTRNLLSETVDLVKASPLSLREIAEKAGVKPRWLAYVVAGKYTDPGVNKILRLRQALSNRR